MKKYIRLLRPEQWIKNLFVLAPMFFGGSLRDVRQWMLAIYAMLAFCIISSAVYCLNDIIDVEADRRHPKKCKRPIASGEVSVKSAVAVMIILALTSLGSSLLLCGILVAAVLAVYLLLNIAYCLKLKQIAIVDVFVVSFGFVLRLFAGSFACGVVLSPWIVTITFLLALFLAFAKRRDDVVIYETTGVRTRRNTDKYNMDYMNLILGMLAAIVMVCYVIYCVQPDVQARFGSSYVYSTAIFVLAGMLRYLQVALVDERTGSPTKVVMHDRFIQLCILCWLANFLVLRI